MPKSTPVFADGLGRRELRLAAADAPPTEHLVLNSVLAGHSGFMTALTERSPRRMTSVIIARSAGSTVPALVASLTRARISSSLTRWSPCRWIRSKASTEREEKSEGG